MIAKEAEIATSQPMALAGKALEEFVVRGNLSALSPADKAAHYIQLCNSLGLNPSTKPFEYITLQGKEVLYARRECTEQLRKLHCVSLTIVSREQVGDVYVVTARATLPDGRSDESTGVVNIGGLKGDFMANALMKCETKAKRRVTLSICGLGFLDESELDTVNNNHFFANLPKEQPTPKTQIVQAAKPANGLPELPDDITTIPPELIKAIKQFVGLEGVAIKDMGDDDLELVISTCQDAKAKAKTEIGKRWLVNIEAKASIVLGERKDAQLAGVKP